MTRVLSAASDETFSDNHFRISAWTSCACSVVATLPVPIALHIPQHSISARGPFEGRSPSVPDRLVRDHDLRPILHPLRHSLQLTGHHLDRLVRLPLLSTHQPHTPSSTAPPYLHPLHTYLQTLPATHNHPQPAIERRLRLARNELPPATAASHISLRSTFFRYSMPRSAACDETLLTASSSCKITRRSEWPTTAHVIALSFS